MTPKYGGWNSNRDGTAARRTDPLPDAVYDQLVQFARSYLNRRDGKARTALPQGARSAEVVQVIFQVTKGDVRIRIRVIADKLGITPRRLSTAFRHRYEITPKEYQLKVRMDWVRSAISQDPNRKIESIAAEVGYTDLADFNHLFRKHVGASPQAYQMRAKAESKNDTF